MNEIMNELEGNGVSPWENYQWKMEQSKARWELELEPLRRELNQAIVNAVFSNDPEVAAAEEKFHQAVEAIASRYEQEGDEAMDQYLKESESAPWQTWAPDGFKLVSDSGELVLLPIDKEDVA